MALSHSLQCLWSLFRGDKSAFCISPPDVLCIHGVCRDFKNPIFVHMLIVTLPVPWHVKNWVDWCVTYMLVSCGSLDDQPPQMALPVAVLGHLEADTLLNGEDLLTVLEKESLNAVLLLQAFPACARSRRCMCRSTGCRTVSELLC